LPFAATCCAACLCLPFVPKPPACDCACSLPSRTTCISTTMPVFWMVHLQTNLPIRHALHWRWVPHCSCLWLGDSLLGGPTLAAHHRPAWVGFKPTNNGMQTPHAYHHRTCQCKPLPALCHSPTFALLPPTWVGACSGRGGHTCVEEGGGGAITTISVIYGRGPWRADAWQA